MPTLNVSPPVTGTLRFATQTIGAAAVLGSTAAAAPGQRRRHVGDALRDLGTAVTGAVRTVNRDRLGIKEVAIPIVLVQLLDVVTTMVGLQAGVNEWNPLVRFILAVFGLGGLVAFKAIGTLVVVRLILNSSRVAGGLMVIAAVTITAVAVLSNLAQLQGLS